MKVIVLLDGVEVDHVCSINTQEGTLVKFCKGEKGPGGSMYNPGRREGHPFEPHLDPDKEDEVCTVAVQGAIHVRLG